MIKREGRVKNKMESKKGRQVVTIRVLFYSFPTTKIRIPRWCVLATDSLVASRSAPVPGASCRDGGKQTFCWSQAVGIGTTHAGRRR